MNIQQIFFFSKWAKIIFKKSFFQHFITVIAYNIGKLHKILHIKDFGDAEAKSKREWKI